MQVGNDTDPIHSNTWKNVFDTFYDMEYTILEIEQFFHGRMGYYLQYIFNDTYRRSDYHRLCPDLGIYPLFLLT